MPLRACRALSARSRPSGATAPALAPALAGARATGARALSTRSRPSTALTSHRGGVHGNVGPSMKAWRNRPLFRREGNWNFKTGREASELLIQEAKRRDGFKENYLESITSVLGSLAPVFDRMPKYAWIAKLLLEPERQLQFRVAWLDDSGNTRVNRGFRVQYSSALGPYEGALHFNHLVDSSFLKACAFDATVSHALSGAGAAVGGADFDPRNKSEAEIQRFCQSYMTELSKYIGPEHDSPGMGLGCGAQEIGYLYGQYKRTHSIFSSKGSGVLYGGSMPYPQAYGRAVVAFADRMLEDKGESLAGKRCLVDRRMRLAQDRDPSAQILVEPGKRARAPDQRRAAFDHDVGIGAEQGQVAGDHALQQCAVVFRGFALVVDEPGAHHLAGAGLVGEREIQARKQAVIAVRSDVYHRNVAVRL